MHRKLLTVLVLSAGSALPVLADTIHVATCGDDTWTGASDICAAPNGPKRTIQAAIDASVDDDIILVADGTYKGPGNCDIDFGGRAITLRGSGGASACIIDCQGSEVDPHRAFLFQSGETTDSVVEGFTVQNGYAPWDGFQRAGGAVFCRFGSATLRDCTFQDNSADFGGALLTFQQGGLRVIRCNFFQNTAFATGGAVHCQSLLDHVFEDCVFWRNRHTDPTYGGSAGLSAREGLYTIVRCDFIENDTARLNGGLGIFANALATVSDCTFVGNTAVGAAGLVVGADGRATVANCVFTGNQSSGEGSAGGLQVQNGLGGPSSATVVNCTFSQNVANNGAALRVREASSATVVNCTFTENLPGASGAALAVRDSGTVSAANCILWGNGAEIVTDPSATLAISYSDIQGEWPGTGNINTDPLFMSAVDDNCRLSRGSPCIDAGDSLADINPFLPGVQPIPDTNLGGLQRRVDIPTVLDTGVGPPVVDMGAYEVQLCAADLNGDGLVDFTDYLEFLNLFEAGDPRVDYNGDGIVDFLDYLEFLNHFDAGC